MFVLLLVVFIKNINTIPSGIFHLFVGLAYEKAKPMVLLKARLYVLFCISNLHFACLYHSFIQTS